MINLINNAKRIRQNKHLVWNQKLCRIHRDLSTLPRMGYSIRSKQRSSEKKQTQKNSRWKLTIMRRQKCVDKNGSDCHKLSLILIVNVQKQPD